jgi:DNA-binding beta-propeller fold protein YncE
MLTMSLVLCLFSQLNITDSVYVGNYPNGIAYINKYLYVTENGSDHIYKIDPDNMSIITSFSYPHGMDGLGDDGENLWLAFYPNSIHKIDTLGNLIGSWASPGPYSYGMTWDSTYLWHADQNLQTIYKLNYNDPTQVIASFSVSWVPRDLEWCRGHLWAIADLSFIYELDPTNMNIINSWPTQRNPASGIAIHDNYLYFSTNNNTGWVYKAEGFTGIDETKEDNNIGMLNLYPNPFHGFVNFSLNITRNQTLQVDVFDLAGQLVKKIFKGKAITASYRLTWDGRNDGGNKVVPGVYLVRIENGNESTLKKIVFLGQ